MQPKNIEINYGDLFSQNKFVKSKITLLQNFVLNKKFFQVTYCKIKILML